jgi:uncharacterized radical SAM superfamily Fe-S cluster-containing enzyme
MADDTATGARAPGGGKRDSGELFVEYTKSICPVCKVVLDAQVNIRDNKVYLRKRCREHGRFEALVYGDAQAYLAAQRFNKPGTIPLVFQTEVADGCPSDCGLCPEHKQHACLGIIEVNTGCNLDCRCASPIPATTVTGTRSRRGSASRCWTRSSPRRERPRW